MERVAIIGENSIEYVQILLEIWNRNASAVLIDWRIPYAKIVEILKDAKVDYVCIGKSCISNWLGNEPSFSNVHIFDDICNAPTLLPKMLYDTYKAKYSSDEAVVLFSSGTTGRAKGVILSHYAINTNADSIIQYMRLAAKDRFYIVKAFAHSSTLVGELLVALKTRIPLIVYKTVIPIKRMLLIINEYNISIVCVNPTLLYLWTTEMCKCSNMELKLRQIYVSGSILDEKLHYKAQLCFPNTTIYNVYGLTEAGPRVSAQSADCHTANSVGKSIANVKIRIVDEYGNNLPTNQIGQIVILTPSCFSGYLCGDNNISIKKNKWLYSGDLGYISNEELFVVGRVDSIINYQSHKIIPETIENCIRSHSRISQCRIFEENQELACEYCTNDNKPLNRTERKILFEQLKMQLTSYEVPRKFYFTKTLLLTNSGKIGRRNYEERNKDER